MLTVDDYAKVRIARRDGMSIRAIAREFGHARYKVREMLGNPEPKPYTRTQEPPAPKLGPFKPIIDEMLRLDETAPPKQRHTAAQAYRRLKAEHGYTGCYHQVRRYINSKRRRERTTFIPLSHDPGRRLEADFGHIHVDFPDGRRLVPVLVTAWSYSNCPFLTAVPTERTEAVLAGMVEAFAFYECVPGEVWWDNPTTVAVELLKGRERRLNARYAALASHYAFEPLFCLPAAGYEKPDAEGLVKTLQRRFATPVPAARDLAELNEHLLRCCREYRDHTPAGWSETIGRRFEKDQAAAAPLPEHAFDPCIHEPAGVDKFQTVRFDNNRYSVPRALAFTSVTVKGYIDRIEVVAGGQVAAVHARCYERDRQILDPLHYLVTPGRRPAALDHSAVYRDWKLPPVFAALRDHLEARQGPHAGAREFIRVLQLLAEHPLERVTRAVECCRDGDGLHAELIAQRVRRSAERAAVTTDDAPAATDVPAVQVPRPDLRRFDELIHPGGS